MIKWIVMGFLSFLLSCIGGGNPDKKTGPKVKNTNPWEKKKDSSSRFASKKDKKKGPFLKNEKPVFSDSAKSKERVTGPEFKNKP